MKNILLLTDLSINSRNAIEYALHFFTNKRCTFFLLHVQKASFYTTDDLMVATPTTTIHESLLKSKRQKLERLVTDLECEHPDANFHFKPLLDFDYFTDAVTQAVEANYIDVIVMGSNGATGAAEVIFGSNTVRVMRKLNCPLLVVPEGFRYNKIKSVLFALHTEDQFEEEKTTILKKILNKENASLRILHIEDKKYNSSWFVQENAIKKAFSRTICTFYCIKEVPAPEAINSFVQILKIDLTVMIIHPESFIKRFLEGSEISKISYSLRNPLLILRS